MPHEFQQRRKSKPRWTIPGTNLLPRKFCSVFSHAFASNTDLASDHEGEYKKAGARRRAFKIARIRCKWSKRRNAEHDENAERSKQLASRFSALFGLGKISLVNKVGTNEDSFTGDREIENRKRAAVDEEELELCKKRILMGERCRALNSSGSLHYDHNGVLLPEFLPYE